MTEYLHDGHGYTREEERAYFQRATTQFGLPLGLMPRLLGRDYLHVVWQANMMSETGYWRLMYTRNLTDNGNELAAYGETTVNPHFSVLCAGRAARRQCPTGIIGAVHAQRDRRGEDCPAVNARQRGWLQFDSDAAQFTPYFRQFIAFCSVSDLACL